MSMVIPLIYSWSDLSPGSFSSGSLDLSWKSGVVGLVIEKLWP